VLEPLVVLVLVVLAALPAPAALAWLAADFLPEGCLAGGSTSEAEALESI